MKNRYKRGLLVILSITLLIIILSDLTLGIGLSPAIVRFNFEPNMERTFHYTVTQDDNTIHMGLRVRGGLSEYVELNKDELIGSGEFTATVKLPSKLAKPGFHKVLVGAKEKPEDEELMGINVLAGVWGVMKIFVPYPGRYAEVKLDVDDVNAGEPVDFILEISNKGKENITIEPEVEIYSNNERVTVVKFDKRLLETKRTIRLKKSWDTKGRNPGTYNATARVNYGKIAQDSKEFRLGTLDVEIVNYTRKILIGGLKKFKVNIKSKWNNGINDIYANVSFMKGSKIFDSFKTSPSSLNSWQEKSVTGYFNTNNFTEGLWDTNITLHYVGKTSSKLVITQFEKRFSKVLLISIIGGSIIFLIGIIFLILYLLKRNKKK